MKRVPWNDKKKYQSGIKKKRLICPKCKCDIVRTLVYREQAILNNRMKKILDAREISIKKLDKNHEER